MLIKTIGIASSALILALGSSMTMAASNTVDDGTITKNVQAKISATTNIPTSNAPNVTVSTQEGKVTLTGTVDSSSQKKEIEKVAKTIEGVKNVDLKIKILGD